MRGMDTAKRDPMFYITGTANKIKPILFPLVLANNTMIGAADLEFFWQLTFTSYNRWLSIMERHIIPKKEQLLKNIDEESGEVECPDFFPGIRIGRVSVESYEKLKKAVTFYLKLYDIIKRQES